MGISFTEVAGEIFVANSAYDGDLEDWHVDAPFGCGLVVTRGIRIVDSAPIFKRYRGWEKPLCPKNWKWSPLKGA